jgi:hypothetical protein
VFGLIQKATEIYRQEDEHLTPETLPSSAEIAKQLNIKLDHLKKKMRILKDYELIQAVSFSPKRYRVDPFVYDALKTEIDDDGDASRHPLAFIFQGISATSEEEGDEDYATPPAKRQGRRRR